MHNPPHSGEFIREVYLVPFGISSRQLASSLGISPSTLSRLLKGDSGISPEMALRLSKVLGRTPESWRECRMCMPCGWREIRSMLTGHHLELSRSTSKTYPNHLQSDLTKHSPSLSGGRPRAAMVSLRCSKSSRVYWRSDGFGRPDTGQRLLFGQIDDPTLAPTNAGKCFCP